MLHFLADGKPFTIISDSTTDISQSSQFEVIFMAYEYDLPMVCAFSSLNDITYIHGSKRPPLSVTMHCCLLTADLRLTKESLVSLKSAVSRQQCIVTLKGGLFEPWL